MVNLQIVKCEKSYKIISHGTKKHPVLKLLAEMLNGSNKYHEIKAGIFSVTGGMFKPKISVFSYQTGRTDRMNKSQYYKWLKGKRQMVAQKKVEWNAPDSEKQLMQDLEEVLK